jgi:hypothetical protein
MKSNKQPHMSFEDLRQLYKPNRVRVLFVGESPPAGRTFFYAGNSNLFRHTLEAFQIVYGSLCGTSTDFLKFFQELGCYLDDLCCDPINKGFSVQIREQKRQEGICPLAGRLEMMNPSAVVVTMQAIQEPVQQAMKLAHINHQPDVLPFPAYNNERRRKYVCKLASILYELQQNGILNEFPRISKGDEP